jgi:hypothetical protein
MSYEIFYRYNRCDSCLYGWDECSCWKYKEPYKLDKDIKRIDAYLKNEREKNGKHIFFNLKHDNNSTNVDSE